MTSAAIRDVQVPWKATPIHAGRTRSEASSTVCQVKDRQQDTRCECCTSSKACTLIGWQQGQMVHSCRATCEDCM